MLSSWQTPSHPNGRHQSSPNLWLLTLAGKPKTNPQRNRFHFDGWRQHLEQPDGDCGGCETVATPNVFVQGSQVAFSPSGAVNVAFEFFANGTVPGGRAIFFTQAHALGGSFVSPPIPVTNVIGVGDGLFRNTEPSSKSGSRFIHRRHSANSSSMACLHISSKPLGPHTVDVAACSSTRTASPGQINKGI